MAVKKSASRPSGRTVGRTSTREAPRKSDKRVSTIRNPEAQDYKFDLREMGIGIDTSGRQYSFEPKNRRYMDLKRHAKRR